MMILAVLVAVAAARPQDAEPIRIIKQSQEHDTESGKYSFRWVLTALVNKFLFICNEEKHR